MHKRGYSLASMNDNPWPKQERIQIGGHLCVRQIDEWIKGNERRTVVATKVGDDPQTSIHIYRSRHVPAICIFMQQEPKKLLGRPINVGVQIRVAGKHLNHRSRLFGCVLRERRHVHEKYQNWKQKYPCHLSSVTG